MNNDNLNTTIISQEQLKQYVSRIERLVEDKQNINDDIKNVYAEAKSNGFDIGTLKKIISIKKMDQDDLIEQETLLDLYRSVLGL